MAEEAKKSKTRSPNYPVISLKEAVERVAKLFEADGTAGSTRESAYAHMGYKGEHGKSLGVLSALKKYGLTEEVNGSILLTQDAVDIVIQDGDKDEKEKAIRKCAMQPELYQRLWEEYKGRGLPSDATLKTKLVRDYKFNPRKVDLAISALKETLEYAGIDFKSSTFEVDRPLSPLDRAFMTNSESQLSSQIKPTGQYREYLIPRKADRLAVLKLEKPVSKDDLIQIKKWLDLMADTLPDSE